MIGNVPKNILDSNLNKSPHDLGKLQSCLIIDDSIKNSLIHTVISIKRERRMSRANLKVLAARISSLPVPLSEKERFEERKD